MQNSSDIKKFLADLNIDGLINIEEDLGSGYVKLKISEAERRQALQDINCVEDIIIELLRNSRDAGCENIFIATKKIGDKKRVIHFIDDGVGIPQKFQKIIFESRVTSKLENGKKDPYGFHGRGMALFSIKLNVSDIKITFSDSQKGSSFFIEANLDELPEKKDQSILPQIIKSEDGTNVVGGVNNIIKNIIEFQFQNPGINIYYGTPAQVLATMHNLDVDFPKFSQWDDLCSYIKKNKIKVTQISALTDDYKLMEEISSKIFNINVSQRSIQRIIYGEMKVLEPININDLKKFENEAAPKKEKKQKPVFLYDEIKLANRFKDKEIRSIIKGLKEKLEKTGKKYFVTVEDNIEFKKINNRINIVINLKQKD
ncbi:MAG: ATP-binding protein [Candidatus Humimicrobiaceae bacterium]